MAATPGAHRCCQQYLPHVFGRSTLATDRRQSPQPERLVSFLRAQQHEEGGFLGFVLESGEPIHTAAIGALQILDALDEGTRLDTIDFLLDMVTDEGGLRANTRIPIADLLSTFTGLLTLQDLNGAGELPLKNVRLFVTSLARDEGGFHAIPGITRTMSNIVFMALICAALLENAGVPWR
ncbi:MAG: hypothetical protein U0894_05480 [Pirellulales bacterium]